MRCGAFCFRTAVCMVCVSVFFILENEFFINFAAKIPLLLLNKISCNGKWLVRLIQLSPVNVVAMQPVVPGCALAKEPVHGKIYLHCFVSAKQHPNEIFKTNWQESRKKQKSKHVFSLSLCARVLICLFFVLGTPYLLPFSVAQAIHTHAWKCLHLIYNKQTLNTLFHYAAENLFMRIYNSVLLLSAKTFADNKSVEFL